MSSIGDAGKTLGCLEGNSRFLTARNRANLYQRGQEDRVNIDQLIFVGLNGRVVAIDPERGRMIWQWQSPKPRRGFVAIMLDGDRVVAGLGGYLYCLDAATGRLLWENPLTGFGLGMFSLASVRGWSQSTEAAQALAEEEAANAGSAPAAAV